jgi:hypothetical protein
MRRNPVDSVQIVGWTAETVRRAIARLSKNADASVDDDALAGELVRWLVCAAEEDAQFLASYLEELRPLGSEASPWEQLMTILEGEGSLDELVIRLKNHYPEPTPVLCTLLEEAVPPRQEWRYVEPVCQRAVEVLVALGSLDGLRYLLRHFYLLCWEDTELQRCLLRPHRAIVDALVVDVWRELRWIERATLVLWLREHEILSADIVESLLATDGEALDYRDRSRFVEALEFTSDPRAVDVIHRLLDGVLARASSCLGEEAADARSFIAMAMSVLGSRLTPAQIRRAQGCGLAIDWKRVLADDPDGGSQTIH